MHTVKRQTSKHLSTNSLKQDKSASKYLKAAKRKRTQKRHKVDW